MMKPRGRKLEVLRENVPCFTSEGKPGAQNMQKDVVRAHELADLRKSKWILGDVTEVLDHNSWKLGKIAKVLKNDFFVIRLTGCIQLREFHISCLRIPHACGTEQSPALDRVAEQSKQKRLADHTFRHSKFKMELGRQAHEEEGRIAKRCKAINLCPNTSARCLKKKLDGSGMVPTDDLVRGTIKKRKAPAYKFHQPTKRSLPRDRDNVSVPRDDLDDDCLHWPLSDRYSDLTKKISTKRKSGGKILCSSQLLLRVREENECSVASCSTHYSEYCTNHNQQSVGLVSCFPDDAMSACASTSGQENNDIFHADLDMNIHELELQAYQSTVRAFFASGPLTWEQESLLTNLRLSLNISNEEHLLQLRHLLSS